MSAIGLPARAARQNPLANALARKQLAGSGGSSEIRRLASGEGFEVYDIVCTRGPRDRPFEEQAGKVSVALVMAGLFACRTPHQSCLLSHGSLLLLNADEPFECSHSHSEGDRCLSFQFTPELIEEITRATGLTRTRFASCRLEPARTLAPLLARAQAASSNPEEFEDVAFGLAGAALGAPAPLSLQPSRRDERRIAHVLRRMEADLSARHDLAALARSVELSRHHFLRMFTKVTGVTPHHWLLRARLQRSARLLRDTDEPITDIALEAGFEDLSNFSRTFRAEFAQSPRQYRHRMRNATLQEP